MVTSLLAKLSILSLFIMTFDMIGDTCYIFIIMEIDRLFNPLEVLKSKSCFLFGPRQTGKSWLIRHALKSYRTYDLLNSETYLKLSRTPQRLHEECTPDDQIVIIDEIQKLPSLLDEIHRLIEEYRIRFLLTGSSARKLRRAGINLLGGRARIRYLHPLTYQELKEHFDLLKAINQSLLPSIYFSEAPEDDLKAYVGVYLQTEIAAEGLTRNIPAFSRFLEVAGLCNGQILNFTKIASDAQVARSTVHEYFQILKDTLLAYELPAWRKSVKRKPFSTSKFYFFDAGVARFLQNRTPVRLGSPEFGESFETYMFHELRSFVDYRDVGQLCYWHSTSGFEVDFILSGLTAIEIKASKVVGPHDLKGLKALQEEKMMKHYLLISLEEQERKVNGIQILPWKVFLERLWRGDFSK